MAYLHETKRANLIKPLSAEDAGYVFDAQYIEQVIRIIDKGRYGAYLIGGAVGTGKTSLVEMASKFSKRKTILIPIKFYDEEESIDGFLDIVFVALIDAIEKEGLDKKCEDLGKKIKECRKLLTYDTEERIEGRQESHLANRRNKKEQTNKTLRFGVGINKFFFGEKNKELVKSSESEVDNEELISQSRTYAMTKKAENKLSVVESLLGLAKEHQIVMMYDELDKMGSDLLIRLFSKYKKLFVENDFFSFFLVNQELFIKYSNEDMMENPLFTYFSGTIYLPLLRLEQSLRYERMLFGKDNYVRGLLNYYRTLGDYRLINTYHGDESRDWTYVEPGLLKALILKRITTKREVYCLSKCYYDLVVLRVKRILEFVFKMQCVNVEDMLLDLKRKDEMPDVWPNYRVLTMWVMDEISSVAHDMVNLEDGRLQVHVNTMYNFEKYRKIKEIVLKERYEEIIEAKEEVQISDMYPVLSGLNNTSQGRAEALSQKIIPLEVDENDPDSYNEALINILVSNLMEENVQVIIIERARGNESIEIEDYEYTGIVAVRKGSFEIAYYVDRGAYKSDHYSVVQNLEQEAQKLGVAVTKIQSDKYLNVTRDMAMIVELHNDQIYR